MNHDLAIDILSKQILVWYEERAALPISTATEARDCLLADCRALEESVEYLRKDNTRKEG